MKVGDFVVLNTEVALMAESFGDEERLLPEDIARIAPQIATETSHSIIIEVMRSGERMRLSRQVLKLASPIEIAKWRVKDG